MVDVSQYVTLLAKADNVEVQVDARLIEFSNILKTFPDRNQVLPCEEIKSQDLKNIEEYYQIYKFNEDKGFQNDKFEEKIKNSKLADAIPKETLDYIRKHGWIKPLPEGASQDLEEVDEMKMKDTLEAALLLEFKELHDILLKAIGVNFWCDASDEAIKAYCVKHNLDENIDYQEMYRMMTTEYPDIFDKINQEWQKALEDANKQLQQN